ncbi:QcrA and Rieske domain-containing protein [Cellulomonas sp. URHB0016]
MSLTETAPSDTRPADPAHHPSGPHDCAGCLDRRQVLVRAGVAAVGVAAAGVLAACSGPSDESSGSSSGADGGTTGSPAADGSLAQLADIPVGGALAAQDADGKPILLTQPEAGTVVGLSAICTHQGCTVAPDDDHLACPCHGSTFDLEGKNTGGPAPSPLPHFDVHVVDGAVLAGKA